MNSFSIIVPVYNVELYLKKCLNSLINQNYNDYEIIIVNDGSTDKSQNIIEEYKTRYSSLIKIFKKKNGGLSSARNYGIKKSTKDYLLFVDSDDFIETNTLEILNKELTKSKCDIIVYNYNAVYTNKLVKTITHDNAIKDINKRFILGNPSACNKLIKRDILVNNNLYFKDGIYYEDLATIPRLIKYTNNIKFIDNYLYNYVVRDESITNQTKYNKKMDDIFCVVDLLKKELYENYKKEIEFIYIEHLLRNAGIRFLNYKKYDKIESIRSIMIENFPNWECNAYFKTKYNIKQKIMCKLLMNKRYFLISLLRFKIGK